MSTKTGPEELVKGWPRGAGKPAERALANVGITRIEQVAKMSDAQLLAIHGVGPKAVRVLRETLAQKGR